MFLWDWGDSSVDKTLDVQASGYKVYSQGPEKSWLGVMVSACNPSTRNWEQENQEFKASLDYIRPCPKR